MSTVLRYNLQTFKSPSSLQDLWTFYDLDTQETGMQLFKLYKFPPLRTPFHLVSGPPKAFAGRPGPGETVGDGRAHQVAQALRD